MDDAVGFAAAAVAAAVVDAAAIVEYDGAAGFVAAAAAVNGYGYNYFVVPSAFVVVGESFVIGMKIGFSSVL